MPEALLLITIDGPAGVGKTTLAQAVAQELDIAYLDSGAMFRAVAHHLGPESPQWSEERLQQKLQSMQFSLGKSSKASDLLLNNAPLNPEIRSEEVGLVASSLGLRPSVRSYLKSQQQKLGRQNSLVAEGRDMGSVVFPWAAFKFFLQASPKERAQRRWLQLQAQGRQAELDKIEQDMRLRDTQDQERELAPLLPAAEAIILDTTSLNQQQALQAILERIHADSSIPGHSQAIASNNPAKNF
ncbi:MAG: (d)CMP kinase [Thermodesulfobacteriota bacterium]